MLAVGLFQTSHRDRVGFFPLPPSLAPCFAFDNQLICFCFEHVGSRFEKKPVGPIHAGNDTHLRAGKTTGSRCGTFYKNPQVFEKKKAHFHIFFPSKKCFSCSVIVSTSLAPVFFSHSPHRLPPQHCLQLICIVAQRTGWAVIVVVASAEGVFPPASLSLRLNQNTSVLLLVMSWP